MLSQIQSLSNTSLGDWLAVAWHGLPLDLSVGAYISVLVGLTLAISAWIPEKITHKIINIYSLIILFLSLCIIITDDGIFPYWGFKLDKTIFTYLTSPKEVLANASWWVWLLGFFILIVSFAFFAWIYKKLLGSLSIGNIDKLSSKILSTLVMLLLTALLFIPIRGSLTVSTMNTGRVYFSDNTMLNLSAVNPAFSLMESLSEQTFDSSKYTYMPSEEAESIVDEMTTTDKQPNSFLTTSRPNVILIIWESMSANALDAMPSTRKWANRGLWFTNAYASSFRTDRGVVAVMSGFPGQPTSSLMTAPSKTKDLNFVSRDLANEGYELYWYYGGDEDFTNMRSYLSYGGFENRVSDHFFPINQRMSKWGVPDHVVLDYCFNNIKNRNTSHKTMDVVLTLSSHEPFEVEATRKFDNDYLNAIAYTDSCVGAFLDSLYASNLWDSTLVVITGDHGYPYPQDVQNHEPRRYHIPIIILGGVVKQPQQISTICSQIDWIPTVLDAMNIDSKKYKYSKDIFAPKQTNWAFYSFNDGWGLMSDSAIIVYDKHSEHPIIEIGENTNERIWQSKGFIQSIYESIDKLSD